jgi:hypothetical protein
VTISWLDAATAQEVRITTSVPSFDEQLSDHLPLVVQLEWD